MEPPAQPFEAAPDPAPEPAWTGPSQEEWNDLVSFRNEVLTAQQEYEAQMAAQQQQTQAQGPALDWLDEDSRAEIARWVDTRLNERIAPIQEAHSQRTQEQGYEQALDVIADIASREGEFLSEKSKDVAFRLARDQFYPEAVQRFGETPRATEYALEQGVKLVRELEKEAGSSYHERQINQIRGLASAPREPGPAGTGAAQQYLVGGLGNRPNAVTSKFFSGQP